MERAILKAVTKKRIKGERTPANGIVALEMDYVTHRSEIVKGDGTIATPLNVLKSLTKHFLSDMHTESTQVLFQGTDNIVWRVEILVENYSGLGQSPRKGFSLQLAAVDLLRKLESNNPNFIIPRYALIPGCRISQKVFQDLKDFCAGNELPEPILKLKSIQEKWDPKAHKFEVECRIGEERKIGLSDNEQVAFRMAAKRMLESLSSKPYPNEKAQIGEECQSLDTFGKLSNIPQESQAKLEYIEEHKLNPDLPTDSPVHHEKDVVKLISPEDEEVAHWFDGEDLEEWSDPE